MNAKSPNPKANKAPAAIPDEIRPRLLQLIRDEKQPVKPAALLKVAELKKVTSKTLQAFLSDDLQAGRIFNWGSEKTPAYWHRDKEAEARSRLLSAAAAEVLTEPTLKARAAKGTPKVPSASLTAALKALIDQDRLRKVNKIVVDLEHPEPYVAMEIARLVDSLGLEGPAIRIIRALIEGSPTSVDSLQDVAAKMLEAVNRIAFSPGTTVTFYRLRQQPELADVPKLIFDEAALLLQSERKALLSLHDHASALPAEERERFVTDGLGTYYVSIYAR